MIRDFYLTIRFVQSKGEHLDSLIVTYLKIYVVKSFQTIKVVSVKTFCFDP